MFEMPFTKPTPFTVKANVQKIKFLNRSKVHKEVLKKQLTMCHASMVWPTATDNEVVEINCTLSEDVKDCINLAKDWKTCAQASFDDFMNTLGVGHVVFVQDLLKKVIAELGTISIENPKDAAILIQRQEHKIYVLGLKERVTGLQQEVEQIVQRLQDAAGKEKMFTNTTISSSNEGSEDVEYRVYRTGSPALNLPPGCFVVASCRAYETRNIHVLLGDLTDLDVDAIVNAADEKLSLCDELGNAILKKGGNAIARDCKQYIDAHKKLGEAAVFVSTAGNLKSKRIVHVAGPVWKDGIQEEDDKLAVVVLKAMHKASARGYKSVALPVINCGAYGYPVKIATGVIVASVKNFFREVQKSELTEIYLCDMKYDGVTGFVEGLEKEFGASSIRRSDRMQSSSGVQSALGKPKCISGDTSSQQSRSSSAHEGPPKRESTSIEMVFDDTPTEILVEDIPDGVDKEILEMLFSSRKLKSCTVVDVDFNEVEKNAVIKFDKSEDVKTVMDHIPIKIKINDLSVQFFVPKKMSTIIVRGPKEFMNEENGEIFEMFFENENRSGGGRIKDINFRSEENAFYITFEDEEVAERVVKRGDHRIYRKQVNVELWVPRRSTKFPQGNISNVHDVTLMGSDEVDEEIDRQPANTVKVRGVRLKERDSVQLYFENKIKSGGAEIDHIFNDDEDDDFIYIRYKDEAVAREVAGRQHTVDGHFLYVSLYAPPITPPSYKNRLLIRGLNPKTEFHVLELYMEAKAGITLVPASTTYHVDHQDTALVTVDGDVDIHVVCRKLEDACKSKPLDGSILRFSPVPISNCVLVSNISSFYTEDIMTLYFENQSRSNGGPVDKVNMFVKQNSCIVYFKNYTVVDNVLSKIQILDGKTLEVKRYIPCIGKAEEETVRTHV